VEEEVTFVTEEAIKEGVTFIAEEANEEAYNFDMYDVCNASTIDECVIYYDWLADNATTSCVSCQRNTFTSYTPLENISMWKGGQDSRPGNTQIGFDM
jgi:hypothetical protein